MQIVVRQIGDGFAVIPAGDITVGEGADLIQIPRENLTIWSAEECAAHGLWVIDLPTPPAGQRLSSYTVVGGVSPSVDALFVADVPAKVSRAQAKIALLNAGLLEAVQAAIDSSSDGALKIWFADATDWERSNSYLNSLASTIGLTAEQVDNLFMAAGQIG